MNTRTTQLARTQLDATLKPLTKLASTSRPPKGWIRAIRNALGMSGEQLARRLGLTKQRIGRIEQDEAGDGITFKTMRHVAEALDCHFVYALIPRTSLEQSVRDQAAKVAAKRLAQVSHSMMLENQQLTDANQTKALQSEVERLIASLPRTLWDD